MLDRQVSQEFDVLNDLLRDNEYLMSSHGERPRLTKEDPIAPIEVLANNVRNKMIEASSDFDRQRVRVEEIKKQVAEKNGKSLFPACHYPHGHSIVSSSSINYCYQPCLEAISKDGKSFTSLHASILFSLSHALIVH